MDDLELGFVDDTGYERDVDDVIQNAFLYGM